MQPSILLLELAHLRSHLLDRLGQHLKRQLRRLLGQLRAAGLTKLKGGLMKLPGWLCAFTCRCRWRPSERCCGRRGRRGGGRGRIGSICLLTLHSDRCRTQTDGPKIRTLKNFAIV